MAVTNTVSAGVAPLTRKYASMFNIDKLAYDNTLWRVRGSQRLSTYGLIKTLGYVGTTDQMVKTQFEEDWILSTIHVGAGGIVSDGSNNYHFLLGTTGTANDFIAGNVTAPYDTSAQYINPVKNFDIINLPFETGTFLVTSKTGSGNAITINVRLTSGNCTTALYPAGTELGILGNAFPVGSDQTEGSIHPPLRDFAYSQITKTTLTITGTELTQAVYPIKDSDGETIIGYYSVELRDLDYDMEAKLGTHALVGTLTTAANAYVDANSLTYEPVQTTEGFEPYIIRKGQTMTNTPGQWTAASFDTMEAMIDGQNAPYNMCIHAGITLDNEIQNSMKSYFQGNNNDYASQVVAGLFGNDVHAEGKARAVNFKSLQKGGHMWHFSRCEEFGNIRTLNTTGSKYPNKALVFPLGTKPDKKSGGDIPIFGMDFKALGDYSRAAELIVVSGAGNGEKVITADKQVHALRTDWMARHCAGNWCVLISP